VISDGNQRSALRSMNKKGSAYEAQEQCRAGATELLASPLGVIDGGHLAGLQPIAII